MPFEPCLKEPSPPALGAVLPFAFLVALTTAHHAICLLFSSGWMLSSRKAPLCLMTFLCYYFMVLAGLERCLTHHGTSRVPSEQGDTQSATLVFEFPILSPAFGNCSGSPVSFSCSYWLVECFSLSFQFSV